MNHMQFVVNDDRVEAVRRVLTILEQCLPIYDPRGFGGQLLPDERTLTRIRRLRARLHGCGEHDWGKDAIHRGFCGSRVTTARCDQSRSRGPGVVEGS